MNEDEEDQEVARTFEGFLKEGARLPRTKTEDAQ
jgi:hypothetical protein